MVSTRVCGTLRLGSNPNRHPTMPLAKKILFASCSAGLGHVRAAEALYFYCQKHFPEIECSHANLADYATGLFNLIAVKGYNFTAKHLPKVYGKLYKWNDDDIIDLKKLNLLIHANAKPFIDLIKEYSPDIIITTHFLIPPLIRRATPHIPVDLVITDYYTSSVWIDDQVRQYFLPCAEASLHLDKNVNFSITGMPLHPDFFETQINSSSWLNSLGVINDQKTILIMAGGAGSVDMAEAVEEIAEKIKNTNLIVVTGKNNKKIYKQIMNKQKKYPKIKVIKFTDKIADLIKLADLVITKPGGMIISECMHLGKPIILVNPIPGQEEKNAEFLEKYNFGASFKPEDGWFKIIMENIDRKMTVAPNNPNEKILRMTMDPRSSRG